MFLSVFATGVQAHSGSIGVYTDQSAVDCDLEIPSFVDAELYIVYFRSDSGPDGIKGAEFKAEFSITDFYLTFTPPTSVLIAGDVEDGIAMTFTDGCRGSGSSTVYLGKLEIFVNKAAITDWTIRILPNPEAEPATGDVIVLQCDALQTLHAVLGGWFHEGEGNCELAAPETSSWGAIKSMYNE